MNITPDVLHLFYLLLIAAALDTVTGIYSAWRRHAFDLKFLDSFVQEHVLFRVFPIMVGAITATLVHGDATDALWAVVTASTLAYLGSTVKSLMENIQEGNAAPPQ